MQYQFRRITGLIPTDEEAITGEPFWDPIQRKFGVFPNVVSSTHIDWYPSFSGVKLLLNEGQLFGGKIADGSENGVVFDWTESNKLTIRNTNTGTVLATFQESGVGLLSPSATTDVVEGLNNRAINGNLSVLDPLTPNSVSTANSVYRVYGVQPGWQLWKNTSAGGDLTVELVGSDADYPDVNRVFKITTMNAPNGHGLRQFFSYRSFAGKKITFGGRYKGTAGATCSIRLSTASGVLNQYTFAATGGVQDIAYTYVVPSGLTEDDLFIDFVYNPSSASAPATIWYAGRFFVNLGAIPKPYESLGYSETLGLLAGRYVHGGGFVKATDLLSVPLSFANDILTTDIKISTDTVVVNSANKHCASLKHADVNATDTTEVSYSIHALPRTVETA